MNVAAVAALLREAARLDILPRFRRLAEGDVRAKTGPLDLVTEADEAAERRIAAALRAMHPGCFVLGEEAASADPSLLGRLGDADLAFVVDPVDGTANFAAGVPLFGVMCAAIRRGETVAGWIHDPLGDDTLAAERGGGAFVLGATPPRRARAAAPAPVARMLGAVSWGFMDPAAKARVLPRLAGLAATVNFRCAAHEYRLAATGGAHLLAYSRLLPWDHAAGALIHAEAGGFSARPGDGAPYSPLVHSGGLVCAPDEASWRAAVAHLFG